jgi:hypothetical protein
MIKKPVTGLLLFLSCFLLFLLYGCAGTPAADDSEAEAIRLANASLEAMNGSSLANSSTGSGGSGNGKPAWIDSPDAVYNRSAFVTGVGFGSSRDVAEKNAFAALSFVFRQTLQADQRITTSYQEAVKNGVTAGWTENTLAESAISTSTAMELVGAEIRDTWSDGGNFYAVAVMEIPKTVRLYTQMIQDNQKIIDTLVDIPISERNSMDSLARFQFAATIAEVNKVFANVLSVIGAPVPEGMKGPEDYRLAASAIMNTIPVMVAVENDRNGRIRGAFTSALSSAGFRTGGTGSRYQLQGRLSFSEVQLPNQTTNKFIRYLIEGNFVDTSTGDILFPYSINGREGHISLAEAEIRALGAAEKKIKEDYIDTLSAYLYRLIPKK